MESCAPIVFVHYGASSFLRQTLRAARTTNPDKPVWFLGDENNQRFCPPDVHYVPIARFTDRKGPQRLREAFVPIIGTSHRFNKAGGQEAWLRFVFERWFIILEFLREYQINAFWTFDSDTLIHCDLAAREERLACYDATEQCRKCCLNGFVPNRTVVESYTNKMIHLFRSPIYLDSQRERLKAHPGLAFNEMDAWQTHRDQEGLKTVALGIPFNGEVFDDALAITSGWKVASHRVRGRIPVKEVAFGSASRVPYAFVADDDCPVRLLTMNLSWLPDYLFERLSPRGAVPDGLPPGTLQTANLTEPLGMRTSRAIQKTIWRMRRLLPGKENK
jgi:hypothetical protein